MKSIKYFFQEEELKFAECPIVKKRKCTDVICLVVFILFIGVWSLVAIAAFKSGNIKAALYPTDSVVSKSSNFILIFRYSSYGWCNKFRAESLEIVWMLSCPLPDRCLDILKWKLSLVQKLRIIIEKKTRNWK